MEEALAEAEQERPDIAEEGGGKAVASMPRPVWSGSLSLGLVNIPVKAVPLFREGRISFRMIHRKCNTPISFRRFCQEGEEVQKDEIVMGYPLQKGRYLVLERSEVDAVRPESSHIIELDRFVSFFEVDPHLFDKTYLMIPDRSEKAYSLLRLTMEKTGRAAVGRMTVSSRERIVLVHYYRDAVVATTLRYPEELLDPSPFPDLEGLPQPSSRELELALEIVDRLTGELDLHRYRDGYRERLEALVRSRMGGPVVEAAKKPRRQAHDLMDALRRTAQGLEDEKAM